MIVDSLEKNNKIKIRELEAAGNDFSCEGMEILAKVLERMNSLHSINLSSCINRFKKHNGLGHLIRGLLTNKDTL